MLTAVGRSGQARAFRVADNLALGKVNHWIITHPSAFIVAAEGTNTKTNTHPFPVLKEWSDRGSSLSLGTSGFYSMARCLVDLTQPTGSYTICFAIKEGKASGDSSSSASSQSKPALLHVVERVAGDYDPNNLVYHHMRTRNEEWEGLVSDAQTALAAAEAKQGPEGELTMAEKQRQLMAVQDSIDENGVPRTRPGQSLADESAEEDEEPVIDAKKEEAQSVNLVAKMPTHDVAAQGEAGANKDVVYFWPYVNSTNSVAYMSRSFMVLVNLKPAVEGHLLVVPKRIVASIHELNPMELIEWASVVKLAQQVLWRAYVARQQAAATAGEQEAFDPTSEDGKKLLVPDFSIAIQQGALSNQTVPHLHTHVIVYKPDGRLSGEPEQGDEESWAAKPTRTRDQMAAEAQLLRKYFEVEKELA